MSLRAEKGDAAHFRRPGRPGNSAHHYKTYSAVANAGARRSGGGGGPVNHPLAPPPAAAQTRRWTTNYKVGNGQGPQQEQQPRVNAAAPPAAQNGGTHASHGSLVGPAPPGSAKPVEARNSKALPKAPTTQPAAGGPETTAPRTPPKVEFL